ncbi:MAG: cobalamin-binding protein, partial [candidate division KSB1 bacterium]
LSDFDKHSFSGWVAPGKGCSENCLYCGGTRGIQKAAFGRAKPFLRSAASVQKDHLEIAPRTWQLRYDFSGGTSDFLRQAWAGVALRQHRATYFLWGVPPPSLVTALAETFLQVYLVLDVGCFSQTQRTLLMKSGLLKPCPSDRELMKVVAHCQQFENLKLEVCGIAGLPYANQNSISEDSTLVMKLLDAGCDVGFQRLEAQPGALVTRHPKRFHMVSEAKTFQDFYNWFEARHPNVEMAVPMVRFADAKLETLVDNSTERLREVVSQHARDASPPVDASTIYVQAVAQKTTTTVGQWLGSYAVPSRAAKAKVTVMRSPIGGGIACAPALKEHVFSSPNLQQGAFGAAILSAVTLFEKPRSLNAAAKQLQAKCKVDAVSAKEIIDGLLHNGFLKVSP